MVRLQCDACGFECDHNTCGVMFAIAWLASGRTKLAYCSEYGPNTECRGVLRSYLTEKEIDSEMESAGYKTDGTPL